MTRTSDSSAPNIVAGRFAARHPSPRDLDALDALLDEADDLVLLIRSRGAQGRDVAAHVDRLLDVLAEFNQGVNACARNPVLLRLLEQTRSFRPQVQRDVIHRRVQAGEDFGADRYDRHRLLVAALRRSDAAGAEQLVIQDTARAIAPAAHQEMTTAGPTKRGPGHRRCPETSHGSGGRI